MSLILLLFIIYASGVNSVHLSLPIPDRLGLAVGDESYTIRLDPDIGSPSPPPKSMQTKRNIIFISNALPGARYEVSIFYTNSTLDNIEVWRGIGYTSPIPPTNLTVSRMKNNKNIVVSWTPPKYGLFTKYLFTLYNLSDPATTLLYDNVPLTKNSTFFIPKNLIPGGSYEARLRTVSKHEERVVQSETFASFNFTLKPGLPANFIVFFRNETTLIIVCHPPPHTTLFTGYKAFIEPPSAGESSIFLKKQPDSADAPKAVFTNLVPGRLYTVYVQTVSGNEYSSELVDQCRTTPLPPSSLTYDSNSITARSVRIRWQPPKGMCEFDAYKISTSESSVAPLIKRRNESTVYELSDVAFLPGHVYLITVKTLSAKVDSRPISVNVTFRPLSVVNLKSVAKDSISSRKTGLNDSISEWNRELTLYTIKWQVGNESLQDQFKIVYFEAEIENGDSNTTTVDTHVRAFNVLLLPGRNYSITVQTVSHGVESEPARIHQVTKPLAPFIDKITYNETDLSITWQSYEYVDSRQAYYEVNVSSDDPAVKFETKRMVETKLSIPNLYPGAEYRIKVASVSHELKSAPEEYKHVVHPRPPNNVTVEKSSTNSLVVRWQAPTDTVFSMFAFSYRIGGNVTWHEPVMSQKNVRYAEIQKAIPGEQYQFRVSTVTHDNVECLHPREITYLLPPSTVTNILQFEEGVNSTIIVLSFKRPLGRIDYYEIELVDSTGKVEIMENLTSDSYLSMNFLRLTLPNLKPGTEYQLNLTCVSRGLRSTSARAITRLRPRITSEMIVIPDDQHSTTSLILRYTPTLLGSTYFDGYTFQISDSKVTITKYKAIDDAGREIILYSLTPGRLYTIKMWTTAAGIQSAQLLEKQQRLYPEHIAQIHAKTITNHSIELLWNEPFGDYDDFEIQCWSSEGNTSRITAQPYIVFDTLMPYHRYTFTVIVRSGARNGSSNVLVRSSKPRSANFTTHESIPGHIENFQPIQVRPSQIEFAWNLPNISRNGVLLRYFLSYNLDGSSVDDYKTLDIAPTQTDVMVENLKPGKKYVFTIRAETKIGFGPPTQWIQKMPIWAPPQPSLGMVPKEVRKGVKNIEIQFRKDFFSEQNGPIMAYTIIVAEDTSRNISRHITLLSWSAVHSMTRWPPYQVIEPFYPRTSDSVLNFTIGEDDCHAQLAKTYCNGPLKSGSTYYVKIRAFTSPDLHADSGYSLPITTDIEQAAFSFKDSLQKQLEVNGMYIGILGCCLIVFSMCVCESTIRTRRKCAPNRNEIRRIGRRVIHSAAATNIPTLQQHHPFEKDLGIREQRIPRTFLYDQHVKLKMKVLPRDEESDRVGSANSLSDLYYPPFRSPNSRAGSAYRSVGKCKTETHAKQTFINSYYQY